VPGWRGEQQDETAAFILQTIWKAHEANLTWAEREATSYWDISDVEEGGFAFANNSFNRAFQLLHELEESWLPHIPLSGGGDSSIATDCAATVGVLASRSNDTCLSVLVFSQAVVGAPITQSYTVNITINQGTATQSGLSLLARRGH
jgi:hypothetical protein